jgi:hypothetical protein
MGIWTHKILLRKLRKERKFMGRRENESGDHFPRRESM